MLEYGRRTLTSVHPFGEFDAMWDDIFPPAVPMEAADSKLRDVW